MTGSQYLGMSHAGSLWQVRIDFGIGVELYQVLL
jgi:hypothetical protein